jgi:hypothetical protein
MTFCQTCAPTCSASHGLPNGGVKRTGRVLGCQLVRRAVELPGAQRRGDPSVAAADDREPDHVPEYAH